MKPNILLSIVIPTRNRQSYTVKSVEQILQIKEADLQVVIQDNSDDDSLRNDLNQLFDSRIKYNYSQGEISFVDNFSMAVNNADGEYICIIGDDDGVTSYILDVVRWAKQNNIDAIKPEILFEYFWPNSINLNNNYTNGVIRLLSSPISAKKIDPYDEISILLKNGGQKYTNLDIIKIYHGIVKKSALEYIRTKTGRYFGGLSPDIYMAVALSITVKNAVKLNFPLTIAGVCKTSGSADSSNGLHVGNLEDAPHFRGHLNYIWSELVPKFYCVETIWADSFLAALCDLEEDILIKKFRVSSLAATCNSIHKSYSSITNNHIKTYLKNLNLLNKLVFWKQYYMYPFQNLIERIIRRLKRTNSSLLYFDNIENIVIANKKFNEINEDIEANKCLIIEALSNSIV